MCGFTSAHIYHILKLLESQITATAQTSPSPLLYMQNETSNLILSKRLDLSDYYEQNSNLNQDFNNALSNNFNYLVFLLIKLSHVEKGE